MFKLTVFGITRSFGADQIGGTDSFYRRVANALHTMYGYETEYVLYGTEEDAVIPYGPGLTERRFRVFEESLHYLATVAGPILVNAVARTEQLRFVRFRSRMGKSWNIRRVFSYYAPTCFGRLRHMAEAGLSPYPRTTFSMSHRLARLAQTFRNKSDVVLPPVPTSFYVPLEEKNQDARIDVCYIGRLDAGKGAHEVVDVMEQLAGDDRFALQVYALRWDTVREHDCLRDRLLATNSVHYQEFGQQSWTPSIESDTAATLRSVDVLMLPYRSLSSSIDTPLLVLEGMASLACCVCPPSGDLPQVYGESPFMMPTSEVPKRLPELLKAPTARELIDQERARLVGQCKILGFDSASIAARIHERIHE